MEALCHFRNAPLIWTIFAAVLNRFLWNKNEKKCTLAIKPLANPINIWINPVRNEVQKSGLVQNKVCQLRNALRNVQNKVCQLRNALQNVKNKLCHLRNALQNVQNKVCHFRNALQNVQNKLCHLRNALRR